MNNLVDESSFQETDFQSLLFSIWHSKLFILCFILLSIPVSLFHLSNTSPIYTSGAVINISSDKSKSNFSSMIQNSPLNFMVPIRQTNDNSVIPEILGTEFLKTVVKSQV